MAQETVDAVASLDARSVLDQINKNNVTHVVWLPDSETNFMYQLMEADEGLNLVPVCREGESMAIAAGLWVGGKKPVITRIVVVLPAPLGPRNPTVSPFLITLSVGNKTIPEVVAPESVSVAPALIVIVALVGAVNTINFLSQKVVESKTESVIELNVDESPNKIISPATNP